jgi:hypothetical protein
VRIAATFHSLWVTSDYEAAESGLADFAPTEDRDALLLASIELQVFHTRIHADRHDDAEYTRAALTHAEQLVARIRGLHAELALALALTGYGWCLEGSGDIEGAVAVASEAIELSERAGAGLVVDSARSVLVYAITQLPRADPVQRRDAIATLRVTIEAALARRNYATVADCLSCPVEWVLWDAGDHRTAALLGTFGRLHLPANATIPTAVDPALLGPEALAEIRTEVAQLDIETAGAIALAALDQILAAD